MFKERTRVTPLPSGSASARVHSARQTTPLRLAAQTLVKLGRCHFTLVLWCVPDATLMAIISKEDGFSEEQTRYLIYLMRQQIETEGLRKTLAGLYSSVKCCT